MSAGSDQSQSLKELSKQNGRPSPTVPAKRVKTANKNIPHAAAAVATPAPASSSALIFPKVEPGTSSASSRLASFRSPRDLSMSGLNFPASVAASNLLLGPNKQKRVYVPNIPTKREKCETKANTGRSDRGRGGRGGGSDRGGRGSRGGRGRGRGRGNNLVQMKGLWAEGVASVAVRNSSGGPSHFGGGGGGGLRRNPVGEGGGGGGGGGGGSIKAEDGVMQRPVVTGENMTVDKDEEDQCLSSLLDDDDVDDADDDDDSAKFYERFCKPMCLALEHVKTEPQTSASTPAVSTDSPHQPEMPQIKVEPGEAPCLTNGHSSEMSNGTQPPVAVEESSKPNVRQQASVGDIFSQNKRTMFLWQLPKTLPSIISRDVPASTDKTSTSTGSSSGGGEEEESASKKASEYCRLSDLPPGQIGFVKVYKSGRAELCLGDYALPITVGCKKAHLEEVAHVSIDEGSKTGKMAVLGRVEQRLLVRPPFEKLVDITRCRR